MKNTFLTEVDRFVAEEIRPFAAQFETQEAIPRSLIEKMAEKGYLLANLPQEYGGLGLDPVVYGLLTESIGKGCASTRAILTVHASLVGETIYRWGTPEQKQTYLPAMARAEKIGAFALTEPNIGTDAKSVQATYRKEGAKYILNGRKKWITLGAIADFYIVIAADNGMITAFIVDKTAGNITCKRMQGLLANRATYIAELEFNEVELSEANILGRPGTGFTYIASTALDHGRYSIAWGGIGIAQEALDAMVAYSRKRSQFGKKLNEFQLIRGCIADATTKIHAGRALCIRAGELRKKNDTDAVIESTIAKYFTSKIAMEITIDAVQVHGGNGCCNQYPVERLFREAKILEIIEGTSQIQQEIISGYALKKYYKKEMYA